jgi:hypothetical protein
VAFAEASAGGEAQARALIADRLAREPDAWQTAYNPACFETRAGNADAAFEHLARSLDLGPPRVRRLAAASEDLVALRADPRWTRVVG